MAQGEVVRVPEEEDIIARTIDASSPYFLPNLMGKYFSEPETLTDEEMFYLYYGYAYSDMYRPLEPIEAETKVLAAMEQVMVEPTEEGFKTLVEAAMEVMERDPFSPNNLNILVYAYGMLGEEEEERRNFVRFEKVLHAIEHSGTGKKESSPWHVLMFSHAADVVVARGESIKRREVVSRTTEFIFLTMKNAEGLNGYYFDFSRIYMVKPDVEPKPEKRGWTLNNVPL